MRYNGIFQNLTAKRLMYFMGKIHTIEARAFGSENKKLFKKCYQFNDAIFAELKKRGYF